MNSRTYSILRLMLRDANEAIMFASEIDSADALASNPLYRKAIVMSILNIGELTKKLSPEYTQMHKEIPWKKISGMRDFAAHGYHVMDNEIIWDVVSYSLPGLVDFLHTQLDGGTNQK